MNKKDLLQKYLAGRCSAEEEKILFYLLQEDDSDRYQEVSRALWNKIKIDEPVSDESRERVYQRVQRKANIPTHRSRYRRALPVAAAITVVLVASILWWWNTVADSVRVTTDYAETKDVVLPDGSQVKLNANSVLTYASNWATDEAREVQLIGEGYFQITRQTSANEQPVKFTVQANGLDIRVIGTKFNVNNRQNRVRVVLTEGQVQLQTSEETQRLKMSPGELATYDPDHQTLLKESVNTDLYTTWKEDRYIFDGISLQEIKTLIENTYGKKVIIDDDSLAKREITATIPSTDLSVLLLILEETLNLNIKEEDERITFYNK